MKDMMNRVLIRGENRLNGEVTVSGMKNAALPILFASLLIRDVCILENIPSVSDVEVALEILEGLGVRICRSGKDCLEIDATDAEPKEPSGKLIGKLRGSSYLLGAELGRFGECKLGIPGGCDFGNRPLDFHIAALQALGANVIKEENRIYGVVPKGLKGASVSFPFASVGATANLMMAAIGAEGTTVIHPAAKEPHIVDLANFLNRCGADISGAGSDLICIHGKKNLHGCRYRIIPDMIEAGTFLTAAVATRGDICLRSVEPGHLEAVKRFLLSGGATWENGSDWIRVSMKKRFKAAAVETAPYPGFPTDMHPQAAVLLSLAKGESRIRERVWGNRFRYLRELEKMGVKVEQNGDTAIFQGIPKLESADLQATDLRAGAAFLIAGLTAEGESTVAGIDCIQRGYCDFCQKYQALGADMELL